MLEHYTSLCVYREKPIADGSIQKFFDPISDIDSNKLFDIRQMRGLYGSRTSRLFLVNKANVKLDEGLFYEVEWTVEPDPEYSNGFQQLVHCAVSTAPTIIEINSDFAPMIKQGDIGLCFEHYKKIYGKPIYAANYIFATPSINSSRFSGLLLKVADIDRQTKTIRSDLFATNRVELSDRDLFTSGEFTLYNQKVLPPIYERILVKNPVELIAQELSRAATWSKLKNVTTHNGHKEFQKILEVIADGGFYKRLSSQLDMSESDLRKYGKLFKEQFLRLLSSDNEFAELITSYVSEDSSIQDMLLKRLRQQLLAEHPNMQEDILKLNDQKVTLQTEVEKINEQMRVDKTKLDWLKSETQMYESLIQKSEEKFSVVRADIANYLSSVPFIQKIVGPSIEQNKEACIPQSSQSKFIIERGDFVETQDESEGLGNLEELFEFLKDNLELIGVPRNLVPLLAITLLSNLMAGSKPLFLFGVGSRRIADCLSSSLYNRTADYLYLDNDASFQDALNALFELGDERVILVDNALLKPYLWQLTETQRIKNRIIIFTASLGDELKLLPRSSFNYIRPLLIDNYLISHELVELFGGKIGRNNELIEARREEMPNWCHNLTLPKVMQRAIENEVALAKRLKLDQQQINTHLLHNYLLPWFIFEEDKEELLNAIQAIDFSLPKKDITDLIENIML